MITAHLLSLLLSTFLLLRCAFSHEMNVEGTSNPETSLPVSKDKNQTEQQETIPRIHGLMPDVQASIASFVPELIKDFALWNIITPRDVVLTGLVQHYFSFVYMIPGLANIPYHRDLMVLDGRKYVQSDQGKIRAACSLLRLVAFRFYRSNVQKPLTVVLFKTLAESEPYKSKFMPILSYADTLENPNISLLTSFLEEVLDYSSHHFKSDYSQLAMTWLMEAKEYKAFALCLRFVKEYRNSNYNSETCIDGAWFEDPIFIPTIIDMLKTEPETLKQALFFLFNIISPEKGIETVETIFAQEGGFEFVMNLLQENKYFIILLQNVMAIDNAEFEDQIFNRLCSIFPVNDWQFHEIYFVLGRRYLNEPFTAVHGRTLATYVALAKRRFADVRRIFSDGSRFSFGTSYPNLSAFRKDMIQNDLENMRFPSSMELLPSDVDYDLDFIMRFYGCERKQDLVNVSIWSRRISMSKLFDYKVAFIREMFKVVYTHISLEDFKFLIDRYEDLDAANFNLNALIEIKGDDIDEFMQYFALFAEKWRTQMGRPLNLSPAKMEKLVNIPGALELLFSGEFSLDHQDFLIFLAFDRAYELLLECGDNLRLSATRPEGPFLCNRTIIERLEKFEIANDLKMLIRKL